MGIFYEHIVVQGPTQSELARHMNDAKRAGYVSPTVGDITVVYDEASAYNTLLILALAEEISGQFGCPALTTQVYHGDVLYYSLYDSRPDYFADNLGDGLPAGGDAETLCLAFGVPALTHAVSAVLHHKDEDGEDADPDAFWSADERHEKLVNALSWPSFVPGIGYGYIDAKGFDGTFDTSAFVRTGAT